MDCLKDWKEAWLAKKEKESMSVPDSTKWIEEAEQRSKWQSSLVTPQKEK
jgi:hypothetical protein